MVKKCSVKNLLLEKILFQKSAHYTEVDSLLKEKSIPTWVSCWMRTTDLYKQIKSALNLEHPIQMKVEGAQWGVGTSGVHFMDLLSYLSDCIDFKFIESNLEDKLFEAKRAGYKEFLGHLTGHNSRGDSLDLICKKDLDGEPLEIKIQNGLDSYQVRMSITTTDVDFKSSNGLAGRIGKASFPYQSEMTHLWVNDILSKGYCDLPTYSQSMVLHLELIRVLTEHMEKITGEKIDACPIT